MASFNKVILVGNVTRDPAVKYTGNGTAIAEVGIAVNRSWFDKAANEKKEEVTYVDVTYWGRTAEVCGEYLTKGKSILVEGRLTLDSWEDKESGQKRYKLRVTGEHMTMLGGGKGEGGGGSPRNESQSSQPSTSSSGGDGDEEVPW